MAKRKQSNSNTTKETPAEVGFESNFFYERLLDLREKKPEAYKSISPVTKLAVEAYIKARSAMANSPVRSVVPTVKVAA